MRARKNHRKSCSKIPELATLMLLGVIVRSAGPSHGGWLSGGEIGVDS